MTMTTEFAEISKRTAKPKRKPRGKPFQKGQSSDHETCPRNCADGAI